MLFYFPLGHMRRRTITSNMGKGIPQLYCMTEKEPAPFTQHMNMGTRDLIMSTIHEHYCTQIVGSYLNNIFQIVVLHNILS